MRSYYAHLETSASQTKKIAPRHPVFRASSIFPVFHQKDLTSRILFMGYWILKRNIQQIAAVATLRSLKGDLLARNSWTITEAKTYRVELKELLQQAEISLEEPFIGSLELEFFSTVNLVYPYPATLINYYGPSFSTVVHTAQRVYNDYEDMRDNTQTEVPESGFNIYADDNHEPFIAMINGPTTLPEGSVLLQFFNTKGKKLEHTVDVHELQPYETFIFYPDQISDLKNFLQNDAGAGKIKFHARGIFPRLIAGNMQENPPAMAITHTYYDCSNAQKDSDYWIHSQPGWYPASLMVPLRVTDGLFTNIYFYPAYSPSQFTIDVEIFNSKGTCLGSKKEALLIKAPMEELKRLNIAALCQELQIPPKEDLAVRLSARPVNGSRMPSRIKIGFDIGTKKEPHMPCNICTNLHPFIPALETKPSTFRWSPILADQPNASFWILNSSPAIDHPKTCEIKMTFFHEQDASTLHREYTLPPNGFLAVHLQDDPELQQFFGGQPGWCTVTATNPYTGTYYFAQSPEGIVGGDHGF